MQGPQCAGFMCKLTWEFGTLGPLGPRVVSIEAMTPRQSPALSLQTLSEGTELKSATVELRRARGPSQGVNGGWGLQEPWASGAWVDWPIKYFPTASLTPAPSQPGKHPPTIINAGSVRPERSGVQPEAKRSAVEGPAGTRTKPNPPPRRQGIRWPKTALGPPAPGLPRSPRFPPKIRPISPNGGK